VDTNRIKTILEIGKYELGIETAIPLGLIINELVSNSLKHAFKENITGDLKIILEKDNDIYTLTVKDDGIGLPADFDFENASSLGMLLVNSLVNQLEGEIMVDNNRGTIIRINFKELKYRERI
jgi:two-component sensor histidine kinase